MEPKLLALHVLKSLARHQVDGRRVSLQDLVDELKVRQADVRKTVSALDQEGYLDSTKMNLTMNGFAAGAGLLETDLPPLRQVKLTLVAA